MLLFQDYWISDYYWISALLISSWINVFVLLAVLLLSGLLRRPSSVNAGEARISLPSCFKCFMFHRRGALLRRLSRLAAHEAKRPVEALLKQLEVSHVDALALAVESKGAEPAPCILLRAADSLRLGRGAPALPPHLLFCQLWRWADLRTVGELKQLPMCKNPEGLICCNPFHWSRLHKPDSPPPPYSLRHHTQELNTEDSSIASEAVDSRFSSYCTGSESGTRTWCKIAYWELSTRVGRLLPVSQSVIHVFKDLPLADGMCLDTIAQSSLTDNVSILQTRSKIGQGITIFKEDNNVWVYNRSDYPIFVNSPTLDPPNTENLTVYKVQPSYSIKIFDCEKSTYNRTFHDPSLLNGPFDHYAVRISFAKGWGSPKYSRRFITSCPCWLEVMFLVNR